MMLLDDPMAAFSAFFGAVRSRLDGQSGPTPYQWQLRLLDFVLTHGRWPDRIDAPTGAGKTCVIDVHVFANALAGWKTHSASEDEQSRRLSRLPRRLALVAPRRALVDDQYETSSRILELLGDPKRTESTPILTEVCRGLSYRAHRDSDALEDGAPQAEGVHLSVDLLRGGMSRLHRGLAPDDWVLRPADCGILHITPDMFGSAVLFRRYGARATARPVAAGLLAYDTVAVVDEAHLNRQLAATARRIGELEHRAAHALGPAPLQVVSTSATNEKAQDASTTRIEVVDEDFGRDVGLGKRMHASKPLSSLNLNAPVESDASVRRLVERLMRMRDEHPDGPIGCIVNTIKAAMRIAGGLQAKVGKDGVVAIVGRMRPYDRERLDVEHPKLLTPEGDSRIHFVVATQTLEVGADLDFAGLVTELAPMSALTQRVGRVNRRGIHREAPVVVVDPGPKNVRGPYEGADLDAARTWLKSLHGDMSPVALRNHPSGLPVLPRHLLQRLEPWDAEYLSSTSESLSADDGVAPAGVELWIRDEFDASLDVSLVVRDLPDDDAMAQRLIDLTPPLQGEQFPVRIGAIRGALERHLGSPETVEQHRRVFRFDAVAGAATVFRATPSASRSRRDQQDRYVLPGLDIRPGDTLIVDSSARLFDGLGVVADGSVVRPVATQDVHDEVSRSMREPAPPHKAHRRAARDDARPDPDVLLAWRDQEISRAREALFAGEPGRRPKDESRSESTRVLSWSRDVMPLLEELGRPSVGSTTSGNLDSARDHLADALKSLDEEGRLPSRLRGCLTAVSGAVNGGDALDLLYDDPDYPREIALVVHPLALWEETQREVSAGSRRRVPLSQHEGEVADRARAFGRAIGLSNDLLDALVRAGALHDEGKRDLRFQRLLRHNGDPTGRPPLAKSGFSSGAFDRQFRARNGLTGWRHEELSASYAAADSTLGADPELRDLVIRLVGTTHGHGRATFDQAADVLIPGDDVLPSDSPVPRADVVSAARRLFDQGFWEELVSHTDADLGWWGTAYLEALLRAADITVSIEEGRNQR